MTDSHQYAVYLEVTQEDKRIQWIVMPPAFAAKGARSVLKEGTMHFLRRRQNSENERTRWRTSELDLTGDGNPVANIREYERVGWKIGPMIVVAVEDDDYLRVYGENTESPYKTMRHINKVAETHGIRVL